MHIAGNPSHLTVQQRELIDLAAALGRQRFAPRAAARAEGSSQQRALVIEDGDRGGAPPQVHPDRVVEGHGEGP